MPIQFKSQDGFLRGTISSSGNDIFIDTSGSLGTINIGTQLALTGSEVIEKDNTGKVRNKKRFNTDGTITQQKFDQNEKITETKVKDPGKGRELVQSGSATENQIEFLQNENGAFITVSGSSPGYNIIETSGQKDIRLIRATSDQIIKDVSDIFSVGINSSGQYEISPNLGFGNPGLKVSSSGEVIVDSTLTATSLNVTHFTSSFVTSSTITTEGNTIFGDTDSDSHTFNGHITASGNISSSGTIVANQLQDTSLTLGRLVSVAGDGVLNDSSQFTVTGNDMTLGRDLTVGRNLIINDGTISNVSTTHITASGNISASGIISSSKLHIKDDNLQFEVGVNTITSIHQSTGTHNSSDFLIIDKDNSDTRAALQVQGNNGSSEVLFAASSGKVGIGTTSPGEALEVVGNISSSGNITANFPDTNDDALHYPIVSTGQNGTLESQNSLKVNPSTGETTISKLKTTSHITASGKILSSDEIILDDDGGDTLVRAYASGDDGIIDVYQNNAVTTRIAGNGVSYFSDNQGVAIGQTTNPAGSGGLTVLGAISSSGDLFVDDITADDVTIGDDVILTSANAVLQNTSVQGSILWGSANSSVIALISGSDSTVTVPFYFDMKNQKMGVNTLTPGESLEVIGNISSSGTITSNEFIGGATQNTGSYDFPGAIMGYNVDGHNSAHNSVALTTSFAVPDERLHVQFQAPKSGIVEIEAQVRLNMGSSVGAFFYLGLSDAATYNSVAVYYEQLVCDPDENDDVAITHKWVVPSLTPGTTYKYWLGAKVSSTSGTPTIVWGGSQSQRFSDFMMKATALPSNTDIQ